MTHHASSPSPFLFLQVKTKQRVDQACRLLLPQLSRRSLKLWLQQHPPLVNGLPTKPGESVSPGASLCVRDPGDFLVQEEPYQEDQKEETSTLQPYILFQDQSLVALYKPYGWPSHPLHPWETETASQWLLQREPSLLDVGDERRAPGLLHRLDNTTSGILLFAKTQEAFLSFLRTRQKKQWGKFYLAWVSGEVKQSFVQSDSIAHDPLEKKKMQIFSLVPKHLQKKTAPLEALSYVWPLYFDSETNSSLVCVQILTGVRHQIRIHLMHAGHPILGDLLYGGTAFERLLLHSWVTFLPKYDEESKEKVYALHAPWLQLFRFFPLERRFFAFFEEFLAETPCQEKLKQKLLSFQRTPLTP